MSEHDLLAIDQRLQAASLQAPNPVILDRQIGRAYEEIRRWHERLKEAPELDDNPFAPYRELGGKKMWDATGALDASDPLRPYLQRWVYRFAEWRINRAVKNQLAVMQRALEYPVEAPDAGHFTLNEMLCRSLEDTRVASVWHASYLDASRDFAILTSKLWQRRAEIAQRLGLSAPPALEIAGTSSEQAALAWIERTSDMFYEFRRETLAELIELGLGSDTGAVWPAHLSWRSLAEPFRNTALLTELTLRSKRLPKRIAPVSFLRGLSRLGEEWSLSLAPRNQPFVVAHDPYRLRAHRDGALFASLAQSSRFLQGQLGVGVLSVSNVRRSLAISLLIESRARALKVILGLQARKGQREFSEAFESETERTFGVHLPGTGAGTVWRLGSEDEQRFVGLLLAFERHFELLQAHDEDWFKNPRAIDQLRSEAALPPKTDLTQAELNRASDACYQALASAL